MKATPLEFLPRFSDEIGTAIWIKRDDCNGDILTAGNKQRKLRNLLQMAKIQRANVVLTSGGPQSNHARAMAALAIQAGITPILVLGGAEPPVATGNVLLNQLMGVKMIFSGASTQEEMNEALNRKAGELKDSGYTPYVIPVGGSNGIGSSAYTQAYNELKDQCKAEVFDWLFVSAGSGGTLSGLLIGKHLHQDQTKLVGISPWLSEDQLRGKIHHCIKETLAVLKQTVSVRDEDILLSDDYIGEGYGIPTQEGVEALKLLARTEAILLDPVYTSKAMAGCIDYIRKGIIKPTDRVLFWHTGGAPSLFAHML